MNQTRPARMPSAQRREQMLDAASIVFGERGFAGATTDAVAAAAGVSQAYVVRTFGSKENLFAETAARALDRVTQVFRQSGEPAEPDGPSVQERLGRAYTALVADRGILLTLMHLFTLGHHPRFGPLARQSMLSIYRILRDEVGLAGSEVEAFLARGMLINTVLGLRLHDLAGTEPDACELLGYVFEEGAAHVVDTATTHPALPTSGRGSR